MIVASYHISGVTTGNWAKVTVCVN
jgi:hypothetical protein